MNRLILFMMLAVTTCEYLSVKHWLPGFAKYLPELISAIVFMLVVVLGTRNRFQYMRPAYWFAFVAIALIMLCGALANALQVGPLVVGMRNYLRPLPLFFLPVVYAFSEKQIRSQFLMMVLLCIPQFPIALSQRMATQFSGGATGDRTTGTLLFSGVLSIFLICVACVLTAMLIRKRIKMVIYLPLLLLILLPTTINETKATIVLLPIGLFATFLAGSRQGARIKNIVIAGSLVVVCGALFVSIYDYYATQKKHGTTIVEFFTNKNKFTKYVSQDASVGTRESKQVGRVDALLTPSKEISRDASTFAFGLGIGNASQSSLGPKFKGEYAVKFRPFLQSTASYLILEVGFFGLLVVLLIDYLIYQDARAVAASDRGLFGALGVGWAGVTTVIVVSTFYANMVASVAISYLFWHFAGIVAAHRVRLAYERNESVPAARVSSQRA